MTSTATGSLPRQRPRPVGRPPLADPKPKPQPNPARHRDLVAAAELEHETPTDWTGRCSGRRCDGSCVAWRVKAMNKAMKNRSVR